MKSDKSSNESEETDSPESSASGGNDGVDSVVKQVADAICSGGKVIPVVGPDAFPVIFDGEEISYSELIRREVSRIGELENDDLSLSEALVLASGRAGGIARIKMELSGILRSDRVKGGGSIDRLARCKAFDLIVTTIPAPLLAKEVEEVSLSKTIPDLKEYFNNRSTGEDLSPDDDSDDSPVIYHLFGRAKALGNSFALSDAEHLEVLAALMDKAYQPKRLFQQLQQSHILFLGIEYEKWLTRFFLRSVRGQTFQEYQAAENVLVSREVANDKEQVAFFETHSDDTLVNKGLTVDEFVNALVDQLKKSCPQHVVMEPSNDEGGPDVGEDGDIIEVPPGEFAGPARDNSIFLCYSRDDSEAAERIFETLTSAPYKLDVFMDVVHIHGGNWRDNVRFTIKQSTLFVPILSSKFVDGSDRNVSRYEWAEAFEVNKEYTGLPDPFIYPIRIDDVDLMAEGVRVFALNDIDVNDAKGGLLSPNDGEAIKRIHRARQEQRAKKVRGSAQRAS